MCNYECKCCFCERTFTGHKREVVCQTCTATDEAIKEVLKRYKVNENVKPGSSLYQLAVHVVHLERKLVDYSLENY